MRSLEDTIERSDDARPRPTDRRNAHDDSVGDGDRRQRWLRLSRHDQFCRRRRASLAAAVHYFLRHCHCVLSRSTLPVCLHCTRPFFLSFWQNTHSEDTAAPMNGVKQSHLSPRNASVPKYAHASSSLARSLASADLCRICERFSL